MNLFHNPFGQKKNWTARMGWRYVVYIEEEQILKFSIEPMVNTPDWVYVPDEASWQQLAPTWAAQRRAEILKRLQSIKWNRHLVWLDTPDGSMSTTLNIVPGSLESTPGGQELESKRFFDPGCILSPDEAHRAWETAARYFAERLSGRVNIYQKGSLIPNSVFKEIELPILQANPNIELVYRR